MRVTPLSDAFVAHDSLFLIPASLDDPLNTPSGYTLDPAIRTSTRNALARVASTLAEKEIAPDIAWGDAHKVITPTGEFAMPGGFSSEGIFDAIVSRDSFYTFDGWASTLSGNTPDKLYGTSYLHMVSFKNNHPSAIGLLPYSQATEPDSPWYLDQVKSWSKSKWFNFPFTQSQIESDAHLTTQTIHR